MEFPDEALLARMEGNTKASEALFDKAFSLDRALEFLLKSSLSRRHPCLQVVFRRRNGALVSIAVGAVGVVGAVEVDGQAAVPDVAEAEVEVAAAAVGGVAVGMVFERQKEVVAVLRHPDRRETSVEGQPARSAV